MRVRQVVAIAALVALGAACGNSKAKDAGGTPLTTSNSPQTSAGAGDLTKKVPLTGVKGVTDSEIRVAVITSKTNPIGGKYHQYIDGIKAYFKMINDAGGIYGRQLKIVADRDDIVGLQNEAQVKASLSDDNAFATFVATLQFTGADDLAKANQPTFIWNINPEFASTPNVPHNTIFGSEPALCFNCGGRFLSWMALKNGFTKAGILAYGVSASSKECAKGTQKGYDLYSNGKVKVAFYDDTIPFAGDLSADVAKMKSAGVQFVSTCMDTNEVVKLAREMQKQGLHAVQNLPNAYDHDFVKANGALFEGNFLEPRYVPWEADPQSPATKEFLDHIKAITNDPVELTETGWIMAKMFVDGLKGAGPNFSQQKVVDYLNGQTAYSAGGMIAPIDWTKAHIDPQSHPEVRAKQECFTILEIKGGAFTPYNQQPGKPWTCLDASAGKTADQTPTQVSFAPGGQG